MVGLVEDKSRITGISFKNEGDHILMLGSSKEDIAASEYLCSWHKVERYPAPAFDLDEEFKVQRLVQTLIKDSLVESVHDCADGGLFTSLLESSYGNKLGFAVSNKKGIRMDAFLFGEAQSRIIISCKADKLEAILASAKALNCEVEELGTVNTGNILVDNTSYGTVDSYKGLHDTGLEAHLA